MGAKRSREGRTQAADVTEGLKAEAVGIASVTLTPLTTPAAEYLFVGEDHYSSESKEAIAARLTTLANNGTIDLYVESPNEGEGATEGVAKLERDAKLKELKDVGAYENADNSLLFRLSELAPKNVEYFAPRPERVQRSIEVDPDRLANLIAVARTCMDIRWTRAVETLNATALIAEDILGSSVRCSEDLIEEGVVDARLESIVTRYLSTCLRELREAFSPEVKWPLTSSLTNAMRITDSEPMKAITRCVLAPHVVSDAVFATMLHRRRGVSEEANPRLVVVVSGAGHVQTIRDMLLKLAE